MFHSLFMVPLLLLVLLVQLDLQTIEGLKLDGREKLHIPEHPPPMLREESERLARELMAKSRNGIRGQRRQLGVTVLNPEECPEVLPASELTRLNLNLTFYSKYVMAAGGVPVVGSAGVANEALMYIAMTFNQMLSNLPVAVQDRMGDIKLHIAVMSNTQVTTEVPEFAYLANDPVVNWNTRTRGIGADCFSLTTLVAEENALCWSTDPYFGENIIVHEIAHTVQQMGVEQLYPGLFKDSIRQYCGRNTALYSPTVYAATTWNEYFAMSAQGFFNANALYLKGGSVADPDYFTRAQLQSENQCMFEIMEQIFGTTDPGSEFVCSTAYPVGSGEIDCGNYWRGTTQRTTPYNDVACVTYNAECDTQYLGTVQTAAACSLTDFLDPTDATPAPVITGTPTKKAKSVTPTLAQATTSPTTTGSTKKPTTVQPTTNSPTQHPASTTKMPTRKPSRKPTTLVPTKALTMAPTYPTLTPTSPTSRKPTTRSPTNKSPVSASTPLPTPLPTGPSKKPTKKPTPSIKAQTSAPTYPTLLPTPLPTKSSKKPTKKPTPSTKAQTSAPTYPTSLPTPLPTGASKKPTKKPTPSIKAQTSAPTYPTLLPTPLPTGPSKKPSNKPTPSTPLPTPLPTAPTKKPSTRSPTI